MHVVGLQIRVRFTSCLCVCGSVRLLSSRGRARCGRCMCVVCVHKRRRDRWRHARVARADRVRVHHVSESEIGVSEMIPILLFSFARARLGYTYSVFRRA